MAYTAVDDPTAYFKVQLYTGNGAANHAITFDDTDTDMQPDLVWIKNRDATDSHCLFDSLRGATKVLIVDTEVAEATDADTLDSFASDGFQVDADVKVNTNTEKYVAWCWKGGTTSGIATNASTTITPASYSFSTTAGISILKYEGNGTSAAKLAHGLGVAPQQIILKRYEASEPWGGYNIGVDATAPEDYGISLDTTGAKDDDASYWNDTKPDTVNITFGDGGRTNESGEDFVAYVFAAKQGFSKFGKYVGNGDTAGTLGGDADGTFVYLGFRPAFVLLKQSAGTQGWLLVDSKRSPYNPTDEGLHPNANAAGDTGSDFYIDLLANGFKIRNADAVDNGDEEPYFYLAFAEAPLVNSNGVPNNAR